MLQSFQDDYVARVNQQFWEVFSTNTLRKVLNSKLTVITVKDFVSNYLNGSYRNKSLRFKTADSSMILDAEQMLTGIACLYKNGLEETFEDIDNRKTFIRIYRTIKMRAIYSK